jgi:hypothetical protein
MAALRDFRSYPLRGAAIYKPTESPHGNSVASKKDGAIVVTIA